VTLHRRQFVPAGRAATVGPARAMPVGGPGMDRPEYGARRDPQDVLLVQKNGASTVSQTYR
jgi:hypothetical protein